MSQYPTAAEFRRWAVPVDTAASTASWRGEGLILVLAAAYSTLLGAVMGLVWPRVAPHIDVVSAYYRGSVAATKALLGDDVWFGFLGILAGIISAGLVRLIARDLGRGPGAVLGVAIGGVLGSLVAAHLGTTVQQPHIVASVHDQVKGVRPADITRILSYFSFKVRADEMLLAWPVTAVVLIGLNVIARYLRHLDD
jgi:hypothetical protein